MRAWPPKDPDENLDYQFDWTRRLDDDETVVSSTFTRASGDVTLGDTDVVDETVDGTRQVTTTVWLDGGTVNTVSVITNHLTTSKGREWDESARVRIRSK